MANSLVIEYFKMKDCIHCKPFTPKIEKLNDMLKNILNNDNYSFEIIDADDSRAEGLMFPTLHITINGEKHNYLKDREIDDVLQFIIGKLERDEIISEIANGESPEPMDEDKSDSNSPMDEDSNEDSNEDTNEDSDNNSNDNSDDDSDSPMDMDGGGMNGRINENNLDTVDYYSQYNTKHIMGGGADLDDMSSFLNTSEFGEAMNFNLEDFNLQ